MERRRFLSYVVGASLTPIVGCKRGTKKAMRSTDPSAKALIPGALAAAERKTVRAVCARILPSDEDPGAEEAHVIDFIDQELNFLPHKRYVPVVQHSCKLLDLMARQVTQKEFADCGADDQDRILEQFRQKPGRVPGRQLFSVLLRLTLEGFFGYPLYGGNHNQLGWKMIGYEPYLPGPTEAYRMRA